MCYGCFMCQKREKLHKNEMSFDDGGLIDLKRQQSDFAHRNNRSSLV